MMESLVVLQTSKLISLACFLQILEYLLLRKHFSPTGIWRPETLSEGRPWANSLFSYRTMMTALFCAAGSAIVLAITPSALASTTLLFVFIFFGLRFRGTFNGGSDYMTIVVLLGLSLALAIPNSPISKIAIAYIGAQVVLSYFVAGIVKIVNPKWRNGTALAMILRHPGYPVPAPIKALSESPALMFSGSWAVLIFECSFPLALLSPKICLTYISCAIVFHLFNVHLFALNRFLLAWAAAYPALYACSFFLSR